MVNRHPAREYGFRPDDPEANRLLEWFNSYARRFKSDETDIRRNIVLKEEHTYRVVGEIHDIGCALGLPPADMRIARMMALFHDVGRFEQYARYRTFVDRHSENHAELSVKVLRSHGVLDSLDLPLRELILRAIRYHNRPHLPGDEEERCLFFSKLLRDADKLDIWKILIEYYHDDRETRNNAIGLGLSESEDLSPEVYEDLMNGRIVNSINVRNLNDLKLLQVGWVYDVNFSPTHHRILERDYIGQVRRCLPSSERVNEVCAAASFYVASQCDHVTARQGGSS